MRVRIARRGGVGLMVGMGMGDTVGGEGMEGEVEEGAVDLEVVGEDSEGGGSAI